MQTSQEQTLTNVHYHFYYDYAARSCLHNNLAQWKNRVLPCIRTTALEVLSIAPGAGSLVIDDHLDHPVTPLMQP